MYGSIIARNKVVPINKGATAVGVFWNLDYWTLKQPLTLCKSWLLRLFSLYTNIYRSLLYDSFPCYSKIYEWINSESFSDSNDKWIEHWFWDSCFPYLIRLALEVLFFSNCVSNLLKSLPMEDLNYSFKILVFCVIICLVVMV